MTNIPPWAKQFEGGFITPSSAAPTTAKNPAEDKMETITLERFAYTPWGVFGRLVYGDFRAFTVERPWVNNKASESCIPDGEYKLQWFNSPKFGPTWAIVGGTVSLHPDGKAARSLILFHVANTMDDLLGCIGLGASLGTVNGKWGVVGSRAVVNKFLAETKGKSLKLVITPALGAV